MFANNTFVAAYQKAREFAADLTDCLHHVGEEHTLDSIIEFEAGFKMVIKELDEEVRAIIHEESDLVMWTCLLDACYDNLRTITMNIHFWGEPQWHWKETIEAASFIAAVIENTTDMLTKHRPIHAA